MKAQLSIVNARIVLPELGVHAGSVVVRDGRISEIRSDDRVPESERVIDAKNRYVLPGFIDPHVHFGFFQPLSRRFQAESAYALSGGITTIMHYLRRNDSYVPILPKMIPFVQANHYQDFAYHLVLFTREQVAEMPTYFNDFGIGSFKLYLDRKGALGCCTMMDLLSDEDPPANGDVDVDHGHVLEAFRQASRLRGAQINVHAEDPEIVVEETRRVKESGLDGPLAWHAARPGISEAIAIDMIARLSRAYDVPVYFLHIGSREAVEALEDARAKGTRFAAETGAQFVAQSVESEAGVLVKVMPPVRTADDVAEIWRALKSGVLSCLGSDHIAYTLEEKNPGSIWTTRPAFGSTGLILPTFLTEGVHRGRMTIRELVEVGSYNTARRFGMYPRKGTLMPGADADLVLVDPDREWTVRAAEDLSYSDFNIFEGRRMRGSVDLTAVRGQVLYEDGKLVGGPGRGLYLNRFNGAGAIAEPREAALA